MTVETKDHMQEDECCIYDVSSAILSNPKGSRKGYKDDPFVPHQAAINVLDRMRLSKQILCSSYCGDQKIVLCQPEILHIRNN